MPDFAAWRRDESARAVEAWVRIQERATVITIRRGGETLDAQTVRIEMSDGGREDLNLRRGLDASAATTPGVQRAVVFGVRQHPTVADTNIERGDRFVVGATEFEVIGVITGVGGVQAVCEART
jgi:hypothetical protein